MKKSYLVVVLLLCILIYIVFENPYIHAIGIGSIVTIFIVFWIYSYRKMLDNLSVKQFLREQNDPEKSKFLRSARCYFEAKCLGSSSARESFTTSSAFRVLDVDRLFGTVTFTDRKLSVEDPVKYQCSLLLFAYSTRVSDFEIC